MKVQVNLNLQTALLIIRLQRRTRNLQPTVRDQVIRLLTLLGTLVLAVSLGEVIGGGAGEARLRRRGCVSKGFRAWEER